MKIILLLLSLCIPLVQAETYLIHNYHEQIKEYLAKNHIPQSYVFSKTEYQNLTKLKPNAINPIKADLDQKKIDKLKLSFKNLAYERVIHIDTFAKEEFEQLQWGIKNLGHDLKLPISDIETKIIKGLPGADINLPQMEEGKKETIVAILDSGIDLNHPDLKKQLYQSKIECEAEEKYLACLKNQEAKVCHQKWANFDGDNNGYPRDCHGYNVAAPKNEHQELPGNNKVDDFIGHGTHVAGIIAAENNGKGILGVLQNVKLLTVKISGQEGGENIGTDIFAKGILYALSTPAKIINLSFGWQLKEDSKLVREMIELAHQKGVLVVAAAGNSYHDAPTYPCAYETVICVGAFSVDGKLASFSNFGPSVDLLAPGEQILSTWPTHMRSYSFFLAQGYEYQSGTSMAAPFVTGALARLTNNGLDYQQAKNALLNSANKVDEKYIRYGSINVKSALKFDTTKNLDLKTKDFILTDINNLKFQFKIKNTGFNLQNVKVSLGHRTNKLQKENYTFPILVQNQEIVIQGQFLSSPFIQSPYTDLAIKISANNYKKEMIIQIEGINVLSSSQFKNFFTQKDIINQTQIDLKSFFERSFFRTTEVFKQNTKKDLIAIQEDTHTKILFIKNNGDAYKVSTSPRIILGTGHIISKITKLDLNNDNKDEYALFYYEKMEDKYTPKFLILSDILKPIKEESIGLNIPEKSVLGIKMTWHKDKNNNVRPLWIQKSLDPNFNEPKLPWDLPTENLRVNRLLTLINNQLDEINIDCRPLEFLNINQRLDLDQELEVLCFKDNSYFRDFYIIHLKNQQVTKRLKLTNSPYFSFEQSETLVNPLTKELLFYELDQDHLSLHNLKDVTTIRTYDAQKILFKDTYLGYTTPYFLKFKNDFKEYQILKRANNNNNDSFFPFRISNSKIGIFRPSNKTLGLSADLITIDTQLDEISFDPRYRFIFSENIKEIGLSVAKWGQKDTILMLNIDKLQLLTLKTGKELLD